MAKIFPPYEIIDEKLKALKTQRELSRADLEQMCKDLGSLEPSKAAIVFGLIYEHGRDQMSSAPVFGKGKKELPFKGQRNGKDVTWSLSDIPDYLRLVIFEYLELDKEVTREREGR